MLGKWKIKKNCLFEKRSDSEEEIFHLIAHSPSDHNNQAWSVLQLGPRNSIQVSMRGPSTWGITVTFSGMPAGGRFRSRVVGTWTGILHGILVSPPGNFTCCSSMITSGKMSEGFCSRKLKQVLRKRAMDLPGFHWLENLSEAMKLLLSHPWRRWYVSFYLC